MTLSNAPNFTTEPITNISGLPPEEKLFKNQYQQNYTPVKQSYVKHIINNAYKYSKIARNSITSIIYKCLLLPTKHKWHPLNDNTIFNLSFAYQLEQKHIKIIHKLASRGLTIATPIWDKELIWSKALKNLTENGQTEDITLLVQKAIVNKKNSLSPLANRTMTSLNCCLALLKIKDYPSYAVANIEDALSYSDNFSIRLLHSIALEKSGELQKSIYQMKSATSQERKKEKINNHNIVISLSRTGHLLEKLQLYEKASRSFYQASMTAKKENNLSPSKLVDLLLHSGKLALNHKNTELSLKSCKHASKIIREHKIDSYTHNIELNKVLSLSFVLLQKWKEAENYSKKILKIAQKNSLLETIISELQILINIQIMAKWWGAALISSKVLRKIAIKNNNLRLAILSGTRIALLYEKQKLWDKAYKTLEILKDEAYQQEDYISLIHILHKLATNYIRIGLYEEALKTLNHSYSLSFNAKDYPELFQTSCHLLALLYIRTNNISSAEFWFERAKNRSKQINSKYAAIINNIGYLKFRQGKINFAKDKWQKARKIYLINNNLDKIKHMERVISRLASGKPSINSLGIKVDTPGPILTEPGDIHVVSQKLPNYKISNFSM